MLMYFLGRGYQNAKNEWHGKWVSKIVEKVLTYFMDGHFPNITDPNNRNFEFKVQSFYCWMPPTCLKIKQKVQVPWAFFFHFFLRIRYSSVPNKHGGALINFALIWSCTSNLFLVHYLWVFFPIYNSFLSFSNFELIRLMVLMLPRIQAQLRRQFAIKSEPNTDLLQWSKGSKYFIGNVEGLLRLLDHGSSLEVRVRGPANHEKECFFFLEEILGVIDQVNFWKKFKC